MLQAAATFSAGLLAGQGLGACRAALPSCALRGRGGDTGAAAFKLSVHVHGAAASELGDPGLVSRPQPRLEVLLGQTRKRTEVADFAGDGEATPSSSSSQAPRDASGQPSQDVLECPWRFGDTLTFAAQLGDILGAGLRLQLLAHSDMCIGPLHVQLARAQELGEASLDLRRRLLPACERIAAAGCEGGHFGGSGRPEWRTPVLLVPLTRADDERGAVQLRVVARVALSVSVNADPEVLLRRADELEKPLVDRVVDPVVRCMQTPVGGCIEEPDAWLLPSCGGCRPAEAGSPVSLRAPTKVGSPEMAAPRGAAAGGYATCEVPPSLAASSSFQHDETPALGGLWPPPPSSHRRGLAASPRREADREAAATPDARSGVAVHELGAAVAAGQGMVRPAAPLAGASPSAGECRGVVTNHFFVSTPERRTMGPPPLLISPGVPCSFQESWARPPQLGMPFNTPPGVHPLGGGGGIRAREVFPSPWGVGQTSVAPRSSVQYA